MQSFRETYGEHGAIISAVDLVRGVGVLLGWHRIDVPGATGYLDTNYANKGKYAIEALGAFDLVCVHVEAPDEASHEGKAAEKVKALEQIDEHIVGPLLDALPRYGDYRMLVEPDHRTTLRTRAHAHGAVAFAACGTGIAPDAADELRRTHRRHHRPELRPRLATDEVVARPMNVEFEPEPRRWYAVVEATL